MIFMFTRKYFCCCKQFQKSFNFHLDIGTIGLNCLLSSGCSLVYVCHSDRLFDCSSGSCYRSGSCCGLSVSWLLLVVIFELILLATIDQRLNQVIHLAHCLRVYQLVKATLAMVLENASLQNDIQASDWVDYLLFVLGCGSILLSGFFNFFICHFLVRCLIVGSLIGANYIVSIVGNRLLNLLDFAKEFVNFALLNLLHL